LIIIFNITVYFGVFYYITKKGIKQNIVIFFYWSLVTLYYFLTPVYFYFTGRATIWDDSDFLVSNAGSIGENITNYYGISLIYFSIANLLLSLGYFIVPPKKSNIRKFSFINPSKYIVFLYIVCLIAVITNFLSIGLNPYLILTGRSNETLYGSLGGTGYLNNFSDSMITCLILAKFYKIDRRYFYVLVVIGFTLFSMMGFRYRIIMVLLGWFLISYFNSKEKFNFTKYFNLSIIFVLGFYLLVFITINRHEFTGLRNEGLSYDVFKVNLLDLLAEQTRGALDDITVVKYYETNESPKYDYGSTFIYFLIRATPRQLVGDEFKDSFYPPPAFKIVNEAYNLPGTFAEDTGERPLNLIYFMISGGVTFLFFGSFLSGVFLKILVRKKSYKSNNEMIYLTIICLVLFIWVTRGYFAQAVDNFFFLMIPYWIFNRFSGITLRTSV